MVDRVRRGRVAGVLLVSDELDDLRSCDRVVVMFRGRVVGHVCQGMDGRRAGGVDGGCDE